METLARLLIVGGAVAVVLGFVLLVAGKHLPWLGKLPGDINIEGKSGSFHFPVVTCIIISIVLTVIINLFFRGR